MQVVSQSVPARIAALDALRGGAMFLGVCLHAAVSYMTGRMPGLLWCVHDKTTSPLFDVLFWWLHAWRLPLFFFLAGFFAALVESARGPAGLLAHRARRLLIPFLVGCLVILPIGFYIWTAGLLVSGRCTLKEILALKFNQGIGAELFGPGYLWFLQDLLVMNLAWCAFRWAARAWSKQSAAVLHLPRSWPSLTLPLWLALPSALVLAVNLAPVVEHHNSFVPDGWRLLYYSAYFVVGAALYRGGQDLKAVCRYWPVHLALSVPVAAAALFLLRRHLAGEGHGGLLLAALLALLAWLSLLGVLGLGLRHWNAEKPVWRYLADASYWVYLCHLPLVGLIQLDLEGVALPAGAKFVSVVGLTMLLSLASYQVLVRHTFVGTCLHGVRRRAASLAPQERRRAA